MKDLGPTEGDPTLPNPLPSASPQVWERLIESVGPASLLLVIERRMSAALRGVLSAEDILQDALLHAWRDRRQLEWRGLPGFRSWLLTIIDHRIHDAADRQAAAKRDRGRAPLSLSAPGSLGTASESADLGYPAGSTTPSKLAMYREQADAIRAAIDGLPEDYRDVVQLRLAEQCTLGEIARRLGIGVEAVRHRLRKGSELYVRRLRSALGTGAAPIPVGLTPLPGPDSPRQG